MKNKALSICCILLIFLFVNACKDISNKSPQVATETVTNSVSLKDAVEIALIQGSQPGSNKLRTSEKGAAQKTIKESKVVNPDKDNPLLYIINYNEGGFIIISGDNRIAPVLAFSNDESFDFNKTQSTGLLDWFRTVDTHVTKLRKSNAKQDPKIKKLWERMNTYAVIPIESPKNGRTNGTVYYDGDCNSTPSGYSMITYQQGLTTTVWDQGNGYNNLCPAMSCTTPSNGRAWVGCVAVAIGQVMMYHRFPSTYNWSSMGNFSSSETARLLKDLGLPANLNMTYGCSGSASATSTSPAVFQNFGYQNTVTFGDYNYYTVKSEVYNGFPVILAGGTDTGWWIFSNYSNGHAWVCDGVAEWVHYWCVPDPNTPGELMPTYAGYTDMFLSMNWGHGLGNNGLFVNAYDWVEPGQGTYNFHKKMVTGIRKP